LELLATLTTEKSLTTNEYSRQLNATVMNSTWPRAAGRATAIKARLPRAAPTIGSTACAVASSSARISAKFPISGITSAPPGRREVLKCLHVHRTN
jgi:hypothetical protein